jgi:hypothetical protein
MKRKKESICDSASGTTNLNPLCTFFVEKKKRSCHFRVAKPDDKYCHYHIGIQTTTNLVCPYYSHHIVNEKSFESVCCSFSIRKVL